MGRTKLNAPSNLIANGLDIDSIQLAWVSNSDELENKFQIERSEYPNRRFRRVAKVSKGTLSYIDNGLSSDITYYYRIKALA